MSVLEVMTGRAPSLPAGGIGIDRARSKDDGRFADAMAELSDLRAPDPAEPEVAEAQQSEIMPKHETIDDKTSDLVKPDHAIHPRENVEAVIEPNASFQKEASGRGTFSVEDRVPEPEAVVTTEKLNISNATDAPEAVSDTEIPASFAVGQVAVAPKTADVQQRPAQEWVSADKPRNLVTIGEPENTKTAPPTSTYASASKTVVGTPATPPSQRGAQAPLDGEPVDTKAAEIQPDFSEPEMSLDKKTGKAIAVERAAVQAANYSGANSQSPAANLTNSTHLIADGGSIDMGSKLDLSVAPAPSSSPVSNVAISAPPQVQAPVVTQQVLAHIAIASEKVANGGIEVRLEPEELGKLRINFVTREGGVLVMVTAERPETLDLLRRNADDLKAGLSDMNFEGADLEFSDSGAGSEWSSDEEAPKQQPMRDVVSAPAVVATILSSDDRLDIRL